MKIHGYLTLSVMIAMTLISTVSADTIYVNALCGNDDWTGESADCNAPDGTGPKATILDAVMSAMMNDTVMVADGIYSEVEITLPTNITVQSENGPDACIINCMNLGRAFTLSDNTIINGFTIINGYETEGGAIYGFGITLAASIQNCIFRNCFGNGMGGAIGIIDSSVQISECSFYTNTAQMEGGAIFAGSNCSLSIDLCHFENNTVIDGTGGAIGFWESSVTILDADFENNRTGDMYGGAGGAISSSHSSVYMSYCDFNNNSAVEGGGAVYGNEGSTVVLSHCNLTANQVFQGRPQRGGAILLEYASNLTLTNTVLNSNSSVGAGGAISSDGCPVTLHDCILTSNAATYEGGAVFCIGTLTAKNSAFTHNTCLEGVGGGISLWGNGVLSGCDISGNISDIGSGITTNTPGFNMNIENCLLTGNRDLLYGFGTIYIWDSALTLTNVTVADNAPIDSPGVSVHGMSSSAIIRNSIFRNESPVQIDILDGPDPIITYSSFYCPDDAVPGGDCLIPTGNGNITANPLFAGPGYFLDTGELGIEDDDTWIAGDYHLQSRAGRWDQASQGWLYDDVDSPCIDAADPLDSVKDEPFANGDRRNMGAYGGTAYASKSPGCLSPIDGDTNGDCRVDFEDFAAVAAHWLECNIVPQSLCW